SARGAVAFSSEEERCIKCAEPLPINTNKLCHRFGIANCIEELCRVFRFRKPAVSRADRIDEDQVGEVEPGLLVVLQVRLNRQRRAGRVRGTHLQAPGPEAHQLHLRRGRAGSPVPDKRQWPRWITGRTIQGVRDEKHVSVRFIGNIIDYRKAARRGSIFERLAIYDDYDGGHMMYNVPSELVKFTENLVAFYDQAPS